MKLLDKLAVAILGSVALTMMGGLIWIVLDVYRMSGWNGLAGLGSMLLAGALVLWAVQHLER